MPTVVGWPDVATRLGLAVLAGIVIGFDRGEHGHPAGLRTTLLVCLAATVAMIQVNVLMGTTGEASARSIHLDLMRLPLGILSGMGFIGAGAILRHGKKVAGLTTAATLWVVTVIGLCFGGGQIWLGFTALAIAWATLRLLKLVEQRMPVVKDAALVVTVEKGAGPTARAIADLLKESGLTITAFSVSSPAGSRQTLTCHVRFSARHDNVFPPPAIGDLIAQPGVADLSWRC